MTDGASAALPVGTRLGDRYRIDAVVGQGGMATVYRVFDERDGVDRAAKVLIPDLAAMIGSQRFAREVEILAQLTHPRIVPVLDSGSREHLPYYVMPLFTDGSLEQRLKHEQRYGVREAVSIVRQIAEGLSAAHREGYVHRDIKPANILFDGQQVRLADFGIARAVHTLSGGETLTATGVAVGTAKYMSPEQAAGQPVDARSDLYSLACVLYELLAGVPPFTGPTQTVLARHALEAPAPLRPFRPSVTAALDREIQRALAKVPGDRHATVEEFAAAIEQAAGDLSMDMVAPPPPTAPRTRWPRGLGVAALVIAAAVAWWTMRAPRLALDPTRIVVFPLAVPSGRDLPAGLGEDVATLIGNAFGKTEPLRWVDGWSALTPEVRARGGDAPMSSLREAARARRARYMLTGRLSSVGDSVAVVLSLTDVAADSLVAERTETGSRSAPWRQALRAANALLPALIPGTTRDMQADWFDRPPSAIAAFLQGEAAFRRAQPNEALGHYRRALADDRTFAIAAFRGAQAASWEHEPARGIALLDSVQGAALAPRDLAFAAGLRGYLAGDADSAARSFRRAATLDPEFAEAWTQLGETYIHLLPSDGTSDARADTAFDAARRLDPGAASTLLHPIEIRLRAGDLAGARPLIAAYRDAHPDTMLVHRVMLMQQCVERPDAGDWTAAARATPLPLLAAGLSLSASPRPVPCAARMLATVLAVDTAANGDAENRRYFALVGRTNLYVVANDAAAAIPEIDAFIARWRFGTSLYLLYAPLVPAFEGRARDVLHADSATAGADFRRTAFTMRLWALGGTAVQLGERAVGATIARELSRRADSSRVVRDQRMAESLAARIALANGDTAEAIRRLTAVVHAPAPVEALEWDEALAFAPDRIILARVLLARGDHAKAAAVAASVHSSWPAFMPGYRAMALELQARAASARGESARAQAFTNLHTQLQDAARTALR